MSEPTDTTAILARLAQSRALAEAATGGEWVANNDYPDDGLEWWIHAHDADIDELVMSSGAEMLGVDAAHISDAHNSLPALLSVAEAAARLLSELDTAWGMGWRDDMMGPGEMGESARPMLAALDAALAALVAGGTP